MRAAALDLPPIPYFPPGGGGGAIDGGQGQGQGPAILVEGVGGGWARRAAGWLDGTEGEEVCVWFCFVILSIFFGLASPRFTLGRDE